MLASAILLTSVLSHRAALADDDGLLPDPEPYGLLQVWATPFDMDEDATADPAGYGDPEDDVGFKIRRARIGLEGSNEQIRYAIVVGSSAPYDAVEPPPSESVQIVDASAGWAPVDGLWLDAGMQKPPVGHEALISSRHLALAERAVQSEWLVPDRDVGLVGDYQRGEDNRGRVRLGVFNGDDSLFGNDSGGIMFAGRAEFVHGPGRIYRTNDKVEGFTIGVGADGWVDATRSTETIGFGGDVTLRVSGLSILVEGHMATLKPTGSDIDLPGVLADTSRLGALAQIGYAAGQWEPAARFSVFDDDMDSDDNGDVGETLAGVTWHAAGDRLKAGGGYVMRLELGGATIANDTARLWMSLAI